MEVRAPGDGAAAARQQGLTGRRNSIPVTGVIGEPGTSVKEAHLWLGWETGGQGGVQ